MEAQVLLKLKNHSHWILFIAVAASILARLVFLWPSWRAMNQPFDLQNWDLTVLHLQMVAGLTLGTFWGAKHRPAIPNVFILVFADCIASSQYFLHYGIRLGLASGVKAFALALFTNGILQAILVWTAVMFAYKMAGCRPESTVHI